MFCYQQNFFSATKEVTKEQFWALVDAPRTQELIETVRLKKGEAAQLRAAGQDELAKAAEDDAAKAKKKLPAFIFQATFDETTSKKGFVGRWRKQAATRLNGLVVLDIDHVDTHPLPLPKGGAIEKPVPQDYFNVWRDTHPELFGNQAPLPSGGAGGGC